MDAKRVKTVVRWLRKGERKKDGKKISKTVSGSFAQNEINIRKTFPKRRSGVNGHVSTSTRLRTVILRKTRWEDKVGKVWTRRTEVMHCIVFSSLSLQSIHSFATRFVVVSEHLSIKFSPCLVICLKKVKWMSVSDEGRRIVECWMVVEHVLDVYYISVKRRSMHLFQIGYNNFRFENKKTSLR